MMRLYLALLTAALAGPAWASTWQWACGAALSTSDTTFGVSDTTFRLTLTSSGRFKANRRIAPDPDTHWSWFGAWTEIEDQIAMIGPSYTSYSHPILHQPATISSEIRAFSTVAQEDVMVLNLTERKTTSLVRCLKEGL